MNLSIFTDLQILPTYLSRTFKNRNLKSYLFTGVVLVAISLRTAVILVAMILGTGVVLVSRGLGNGVVVVASSLGTIARA